MIRSIVIFIVGCFLCACGEKEEEVEVETRITKDYPPTFGDKCEVDAGMCEVPFSCLGRNDNFICTQTCQVTEGCPWMEMVGHCTGKIYAKCREGGSFEGLCVPVECL